MVDLRNAMIIPILDILAGLSIEIKEDNWKASISEDKRKTK
jgi:hypothetical protein